VAVEVWRSKYNEELCQAVEPVTVEDLEGFDILERPDGLIVFLDDRDFDNEADALAYANEKRQRNPLMMTAAELRAKEVAS
jgi:hypothetical protein